MCPRPCGCSQFFCTSFDSFFVSCVFCFEQHAYITRATKWREMGHLGLFRSATKTRNSELYVRMCVHNDRRKRPALRIGGGEGALDGLSAIRVDSAKNQYKSFKLLSNMRACLVYPVAQRHRRHKKKNQAWRETAIPVDSLGGCSLYGASHTRTDVALSIGSGSHMLSRAQYAE